MPHRVFVLALLSATTAVADDLPPPGGVGERLEQTQFVWCTFAEDTVIPIVRRESGIAMINPSGRVILQAETRGRLVFIDGADMTQIDGANSFAVVDGALTTGTCTDMSRSVLHAIALSMGTELRAGMNAIESQLRTRLIEESTARAEAEAAMALALAELEAARQVGPLVEPFCEGVIPLLGLVAASLEGPVEDYPTIQAAVNAANAARLRDIIDRCS